MINEKSLKKSFEKIKKDIIGLQNHILEVEKKYEDLWNVISSLMEKDIELSKEVEQTAAISQKLNKASKKTSQKKDSNSKQIFVASKTAKKYHVPDCTFAKQITPTKKIIFNSKETARKKGYTACECIKKR